MNRILQRLAAAFVLLVLLASASSAVLAQSSISVIASSHKNDFPNQIRFALEASSSADITKVTLYYKTKGDSILTYAYPKFEPGKRVQAEHVWNTQTKYIPPGVELSYYWIIEDAAGNKLKTEPASFAIEDTRFKWQKQTNDKVTVFWYQGDTRFASSLLQYANKALEATSRDVGILIQEPVKIYIYANGKDLRGALEPKAHEWTGGRSFSDLGIIALTVEPNAAGLAWAERAVPHELNHVVVHQATHNPYGDIPQWLSEGLAMHAEGGLEPSYQRTLEAAIKSNRLISMKSLGSNFPADSDQARLSYAESYSIIDFILERYGREKMAALLAVFKEGSTYDDALMAALGVVVDGLEAQWRTSLGLEPAAAPVAPRETSKDAAKDGGTPTKPQAEAQPKQESGGICGSLFQVLALGGAALAFGARIIRP